MNPLRSNEFARPGPLHSCARCSPARRGWIGFVLYNLSVGVIAQESRTTKRHKKSHKKSHKKNQSGSASIDAAILKNKPDQALVAISGQRLTNHFCVAVGCGVCSTEVAFPLLAHPGCQMTCAGRAVLRFAGGCQAEALFSSLVRLLFRHRIVCSLEL